MAVRTGSAAAEPRVGVPAASTLETWTAVKAWSRALAAMEAAVGEGRARTDRSRRAYARGDGPAMAAAVPATERACIAPSTYAAPEVGGRTPATEVAAASAEMTATGEATMPAAAAEAAAVTAAAVTASASAAVTPAASAAAVTMLCVGRRSAGHGQRRCGKQKTLHHLSRTLL